MAIALKLGCAANSKEDYVIRQLQEGLDRWSERINGPRLDFVCHWSAASALGVFLRDKMDLLFIQPHMPIGVPCADLELVRIERECRGDLMGYQRQIGTYLVRRLSARGSVNHDTPIVVLDNADSGTADINRAAYTEAGATHYAVMGTEDSEQLPFKIRELLRI
jgi:hypothetical protein